MPQILPKAGPFCTQEVSFETSKVCPVFYFEAAEPLSAFSKELKRTKDRFETYAETKNKLHYSGPVPTKSQMLHPQMLLKLALRASRRI
jgi:hypothetical protein